MHTFKKQQKHLIEIYENIASLDASIAIASYINSLPKFCKPIYNKENIIEVTDIYHPLIENCVPNSFSVSNKSCLITGSNMAGKTTFIKIIGVNIILSRSINICLAESANLPEVFVKSTIKRQDDLIQKKSYYFKEIEAILKFIQLADSNKMYIFLIDEIFRGTNTIERLSSATAVLDYLSSKNISLVTTHDIELQELLNGQFQMFHFREQIENDTHFFDYKIKSGPCNSGNAIKLLELKGYPSNIVERAYSLSKSLNSNE